MKKYIKEILEEMGHSKKTIETMTPGEIFEEVLKYEGFIGYASSLKSWIKDIYNIELK